jgi:succinate dehydrogenase / fumarate reductase cytochrome b subunit
MSRFNQLFSSTIGKKLIMSLTGIFLSLFLVIHLIGNLQLFKSDGGLAFNEYAYFMTNFAPIKVVSYLLYATFVLHAVYALIITYRNRKARPIAYASYDGAANSPWNSRNMGLLGTIILIFLVTHMSNFWYQYHWGDVPYVEYTTNIQSGETSVREIPAAEFHSYVNYIENGSEILIAKDLYKQVNFSFQSWYLVAFYVLSMLALGFHLAHGFKTAFQTLGFDHNRYAPLIRAIGFWIFGILIPLLFAAMPLYSFFVVNS